MGEARGERGSPDGAERLRAFLGDADEGRSADEILAWLAG